MRTKLESPPDASMVLGSKVMPLACSSVGSQLYLLESSILPCPAIATQVFSRVGGWSFLPGTTKLFCLPRTSPDHHTRNNKVCFLVLFATVRHPVGTLRTLGLAIPGRAGHPGWTLPFSVASPAEVLSSPEWTRAGVGNTACALAGQ